MNQRTACVALLPSTILLLAVALDAQVTRPPGLVSLWEANASAKDSHGNNHGTMSGSATYSTGRSGGAFQFNGTKGLMMVPDHSSLQLTGTITIEFWAKRPAGYFGIVLEKGGDWTRNYTNYGVGLHSARLGNMLYFFYAGGWQGADGPGDSKWHHYAVVAKNSDSSPKFFIDGVPKTATRFGGSRKIRMAVTKRSLNIGAQLGTYTYYSQFTIDDVALYKVALTAQQIKLIYESAAFTTYRKSCTSSVGMPSLTAVTQPRIGTTFKMQVTALGANKSGAFMVGLDDDRWMSLTLPFDLGVIGAPGCFVNVNGLLDVFAKSDNSGTVAISIPIPNDPSHLGTAVYFQYRSIFDAPTSRLLPISTTNAGKAVVGR